MSSITATLVLKEPLTCFTSGENVCACSFFIWISLVAQTVKNLSAMQDTWVQSLGWENPLEKGKATHTRILAWKIPWTEEPGGYSLWGRKGSDMTEWFNTFTFFLIYHLCKLMCCFCLFPSLLGSQFPLLTWVWELLALACPVNCVDLLLCMDHHDASCLLSSAPVPFLWLFSFIIAFRFSALMESVKHVGAIPILKVVNWSVERWSSC